MNEEKKNKNLYWMVDERNVDSLFLWSEIWENNAIWQFEMLTNVW